jgi:hypothetical protein
LDGIDWEKGQGGRGMVIMENVHVLYHRPSDHKNFDFLFLIPLAVVAVVEIHTRPHYPSIHPEKKKLTFEG